MSISITSFEHVLATTFHDIAIGEKKAVAVISKLENSADTIEAITALVPGFGTQAAGMERVGFALLGNAAAALTAIGDAATAQGVNVSLDAEMVAAVKALIAAFPAEIAAAKAAWNSQQAAQKALPAAKTTVQLSAAQKSEPVHIGVSVAEAMTQKPMVERT
jgi:hypothetical protein